MAFRDAVLADSPLFYFECNQTAGTVMADSSGNGHAGTLIGSAVLGQAPMRSGSGAAVAFSGGRIEVADTVGMAFSGDYSIETIQRWSDSFNALLFAIYNTSGSTQGPAIYWNAAVNGGVGAGPQIMFRDAFAPGYGFAYACTFSDNVFRHIIYIRRGLNLEIWVSGVLVATLTLPAANSFTASDPASVMGNRYAQYANGATDEVAFYTHALSAERIAYHARLAADLWRLAGSAKLDNGVAASAVVARDWTSHAHVAATVPATDGTFEMFVPAANYDVTVFGPTGYQPITHGPVAAVSD